MRDTGRFLYLHGFASGPDSNKARFFAQKLAAYSITLERPDLADGDFEHMTITSQLAVIVRAAEGGRVTLFGSSLGGYLAALYASVHPEVEKLVLFAPAFCFAKRWVDWLGAAALAEWKRTGGLTVYHYAQGGTRRLGYGIAEDAASYPDFPEFSQPALILHGSQDQAVPVGLSEQFAAAHTNATLRVLDSDHELLNVLEPMWTEIESFLWGPPKPS